jgi:hypothetical protein
VGSVCVFKLEGDCVDECQEVEVVHRHRRPRGVSDWLSLPTTSILYYFDRLGGVPVPPRGRRIAKFPYKGRKLLLWDINDYFSVPVLRESRLIDGNSTVFHLLS